MWSVICAQLLEVAIGVLEHSSIVKYGECLFILAREGG